MQCQSCFFGVNVWCKKNRVFVNGDAMLSESWKCVLTVKTNVLSNFHFCIICVFASHFIARGLGNKFWTGCTAQSTAISEGFRLRFGRELEA